MTRPTMGNYGAGAQPVLPDPAHTTVVAKNNGKSDAPDSRGGIRSGVLERNGFKGAPQISYAYPDPTAPGAKDTYRNVRILPPSKGYSDFYAARADTGQRYV